MAGQFGPWGWTVKHLGPNGTVRTVFWALRYWCRNILTLRWRSVSVPNCLGSDCKRLLSYMFSWRTPYMKYDTNIPRKQITKVIRLLLNFITNVHNKMLRKTHTSFVNTCVNKSLAKCRSDQMSRIGSEWGSLYIVWSDVTESISTIGSPFCGYNMA